VGARSSKENLRRTQNRFVQSRKKTSGEDKPEVKVTKSEFKVVKKGEKEKINGFSCEEYIVNRLLGRWGSDGPKKSARIRLIRNERSSSKFSAECIGLGPMAFF
jgi:hypothetical protein